ncbi:MAG: hypothetical protein ABJA85_01780 [Bacteroidota bacterium]
MNSLLKLSSTTIFTIILLTSCKKYSLSVSYETKIGFIYNGQQYERTSPSRIQTDVIVVQGTPLFVNFYGLSIEDQNLFGGSINIISPNPGPIQCAYFRPAGMSVSSFGPNCILTNGGNPIDSLQVYWYESGSLSFSYSDCRDLTGTTVPGQRDCGITGNFDLMLTNKNNQKIKLTNGYFSGRLKKYP